MTLAKARELFNTWLQFSSVYNPNAVWLIIGKVQREHAARWQRISLFANSARKKPSA